MPQEIRYISQRDLENLPEVVRAGTSLELGGFYTTRDMPRERFLATLELKELNEKYLSTLGTLGLQGLIGKDLK